MQCLKRPSLYANKLKNLFRLSVRQSLKKVPKEGKLHPDLIKHWPEIFKDIDVRSIPLEYLNAVYVTFDDGKVWAIELDENANKDAKPEDIEYGVEELLDQYEDVIENVDFRINTKKIKHDMQRRTKHFLKKGK